jgi:hypothetical protein
MRCFDLGQDGELPNLGVCMLKSVNFSGRHPTASKPGKSLPLTH